MKSIILLFIVTMINHSTTSYATEQGGNSSGGGAGIVCRDASGRVESAQLFDLFDAENDPGNPKIINRNELSPDDQIKGILNKLQLQSKFNMTESDAIITRSELSRAINLVKRDWRYLQPGLKLPFKPDFSISFLPSKPNCKVETIANYNDDLNILAVDQDSYSKLSKTDQAALVIHEALYKRQRIIYGDTTSDSTRSNVSRLFEVGALEGDKLFQLTGFLDLMLIFDHIEGHTDPEIEGLEYVDRFKVKKDKLSTEVSLSNRVTDLIFGNRSLYCEDSIEKSINLVISADSINVVAEGTAPVSMGDLESSINQMQEYNGKTFVGYSWYISIKASDADGSELKLYGWDIFSDSVASKKSIIKAEYKYFGEYSEEQNKTFRMNCSFQEKN